MGLERRTSLFPAPALRLFTPGVSCRDSLTGVAAGLPRRLFAPFGLRALAASTSAASDAPSYYPDASYRPGGGAPAARTLGDFAMRVNASRAGAEEHWVARDGPGGGQRNQLGVNDAELRAQSDAGGGAGAGAAARRRATARRRGLFGALMARLGVHETEWRGELALGGAGSGAPVRIGATALHLAIAGRRVWHLASLDDGAVWSELPMGAWLALPAAARPRTLRCTQAAGDLLFVPSGFASGALNVEAPALGVAWEWAGSWRASRWTDAAMMAP